MKLAAVVVAYEMDTDKVVGNIESYGDKVDVLIVWDNSETRVHDWSAVKRFRADAIVNQDMHNIGLARAYNNACRMAKERGCTHLMTMDQDSLFVNFDAYREQIVDNGITCVGVNRSDWQQLSAHEVGFACQSGSTFPIAMLEDIGGFRDDFFISMVDADICLSAEAHGYSIMQAGRCTIKHPIGSGRKVAVFGHSIAVSDYTALRHYYDSRNRILMWWLYPDDCDLRFKMHHFKGRIKLMLKILLFEQDKYHKILAIIRGTYSGLQNKYTPF
ncbi:MAG: hypothetical protein IJ745_01720 [Bacteroidales bacterium]|nr:hypothetical protein [Bacteroidales bacterium]